MTDAQAHIIHDCIKRRHPDSKFGVVSSKHEPLTPLGSGDDDCSKVNAPLSDDLDTLEAEYASIASSGGAKAPVSQFGVLYDGLGNAAIGESGVALATKLIVISTDAGPYLAGNIRTGQLPPFNPANYQDKRKGVCLAQYCPSPVQVEAKISNACVAFLVYDSDWANGLRLRGLASTLTATPTTAVLPTMTSSAVVTTAGASVTTTALDYHGYYHCAPKTVTPPAPSVPCECPCDTCICCPVVVNKLPSKPEELHLDVKN